MIRYFRVQIANALANTAAEGFVDPYHVWDYSNFDNSSTAVAGVNIPGTYAAAVLRAKSKARYTVMMNNLSFTRSPAHIGAIVATAGTAGVMPTAVEFTIGYGVQDESVAGATVPSDLYTYNESVAGILTGQNAVKRLVARALYNTIENVQISLHDPRDSDNNPLAAVGYPWAGETTMFADLGSLDILANVEAQITVTEIANIN